METEAMITQENEEIRDLSDIKRKMRLTGTVVKTTLAGALVNIGLETLGVVHISQLQQEPVNRVEDVVQPGQSVDVWVRRVIPKKNRLELTMIEPLELEWREIDKDMVVKGKVTRLERFGAFVDIGAERPGLVHISELTHDFIKNAEEAVKEGDEVEVKVLSVNRKKKQIKLSMKALEAPPIKVAKAKIEEEMPSNEPVPTAMEVAIREAMERSQEQGPEKDSALANQKSEPDKGELEKILMRTLKNRVRSK